MYIICIKIYIERATCKTEDLSRTCKQLLSRKFKTKWANEDN